MNSPTGLPRIVSKLHLADTSVSEGSILGLLDAPLTSGVFQVVFDSCTVRKVRIFIYILLLSENIRSEESESCEKTPGETEGMEAVGNTSLIAGYHSRAQIKRTHMKHFEMYLQA